MKKQKNSWIASTIAIGMSVAITGSALASEPVLTRSTGAPVGNNQNSS